MKILSSLNNVSKVPLFLIGLVLIGFIGAIDYLTGPEISFSVFYLIPVSMVAWYVGMQGGILAATLSAITWLVADLLSHTYSHPSIPFWNALVRYSFFLIVSFALTSLRSARTRQEEMLHFIVHDLKSPLSNVSTSLELLQDSASGKMDEDEQKIVAMCVASCNRVITLILSLLDLARLEGGKLPLRQRVVGIKEMVEAAAQQLYALAIRSDVSIVTHFDEGASVFADFDVTVRVLVNLLSNALKFSPAQATVTISALPRDHDTMAFEVNDKGSGIPAEWQDKVFDRFSQIDTQKAGPGTGTGLGLAFCRAAIEAQGGHIWVQSEPGKGTTMIFTLPIQAGQS